MMVSHVNPSTALRNWWILLWIFRAQKFCISGCTIMVVRLRSRDGDYLCITSAGRAACSGEGFVYFSAVRNAVNDNSLCTIKQARTSVEF